MKVLRSIKQAVAKLFAKKPNPNLNRQSIMELRDKLQASMDTLDAEIKDTQNQELRERALASQAKAQSLMNFTNSVLDFDDHDAKMTAKEEQMRIDAADCLPKSLEDKDLRAFNKKKNL